MESTVVAVVVWISKGGSGTSWLGGGEESSCAGSSVAAAGWTDTESSSAEVLVSGGEDVAGCGCFCNLSKSQKEGIMRETHSQLCVMVVYLFFLQ